MIARIVFAALSAMAASVLGGCAGMQFGPDQSYYQAQADQNAAYLAIMAQPEFTIETDGPARISYRGDIEQPQAIDEGSTFGRTVRETLPTIVQWGVGGYVLGKLAENAGDRYATVEGDGNIDMRETREYNIAREGGSANNDNRSNYENQQPVNNDSRANYANNQPVDNRSNYENQTAEPYIVTQPPPLTWAGPFPTPPQNSYPPSP